MPLAFRHFKKFFTDDSGYCVQVAENACLRRYFLSFKEPRNWFHQPTVCSLVCLYVKKGCRTGPPGWKSIPGLLEGFTNAGSGERKDNFGFETRLESSQMSKRTITFCSNCYFYLTCILYCRLMSSKTNIYKMQNKLTLKLHGTKYCTVLVLYTQQGTQESDT